MSVSVIVGGQFGSEGKGKVSLYFARKFGVAAVVRVGGTNSGHTVVDDLGNPHIFRSLPTASIDSAFLNILPSGSYLDLDIFAKEVKNVNADKAKIMIDPYAVIIDEEMKSEEQTGALLDSIGSTQSGTGAAVKRRIERQKSITFARDVDDLNPFISDTKSVMRQLLNNGQHIVIEGTQGFGLSPINAANIYPFCTSRDTTASSFVAEAGLSPLDVSNIIMVIRSFPIRVSGNSGPIGPLENETDWETIKQSSGSSFDLTEYTSATKRIRRVAKFDAEIVKRAITVNNPNIIVMNHLDYIDYSCHDSASLSEKICSFILDVESQMGCQIDYIGTGQSLLTARWEG